MYWKSLTTSVEGRWRFGGRGWKHKRAVNINQFYFSFSFGELKFDHILLSAYRKDLYVYVHISISLSCWESSRNLSIKFSKLPSYPFNPSALRSSDSVEDHNLWIHHPIRLLWIFMFSFCYRKMMNCTTVPNGRGEFHFYYHLAEKARNCCLWLDIISRAPVRSP